MGRQKAPKRNAEEMETTEEPGPSLLPKVCESGLISNWPAPDYSLNHKEKVLQTTSACESFL